LGHVWLLSQDPKGCRVVQEAMETASSDVLRAELGSELRGQVVKAMRCPHANHVVQKYISVARPEQSQFIVDELLERSGLVAQAVRHRYGCRVLQQLLKFCTPCQLQEIVEQILDDAIPFSCHSFGNFVMQCLAECGTENQRHRLIRELERNIHRVCGCSPGRSVVSSALQYGEENDRMWLARAILQEPNLLLALARWRHGSAPVAFMLQALTIREREEARRILAEDPEGSEAL